MANTTAQTLAATWIREHALPDLFGRKFRNRSLLLKSKGEVKLDAVSEDGKIVAVISTSEAKTKKGRLAVGKLMKVRADAYWLFMLAEPPERCIFIFTGRLLHILIICYCRFSCFLYSAIHNPKSEIAQGRFPLEFSTLKLDIPPDLAETAKESRLKAVNEMSPEIVSPSPLP